MSIARAKTAACTIVPGSSPRMAAFCRQITNRPSHRKHVLHKRTVIDSLLHKHTTPVLAPQETLLATQVTALSLYVIHIYHGHTHTHTRTHTYTQPPPVIVPHQQAHTVTHVHSYTHAHHSPPPVRVLHQHAYTVTQVHTYTHMYVPRYGRTRSLSNDCPTSYERVSMCTCVRV